MAKPYPIAEMFWSLQGEGVFTGTPMLFCRLAGCNVGAYLQPEVIPNQELRILREENPGLSVCTSALGQQFLCDTNYQAVEKLDLDGLFDAFTLYPPYEHLCITGGEPFLHDLGPIVARANDRGIQVHVETSGTKPIPSTVGLANTWVTCSPKLTGDLPAQLRANAVHIHEWKFVVDRSLGTPEEVIARIEDVLSLGGEDTDRSLVFVQAINGVTSWVPENMAFVLEVLKLAPTWRFSGQYHKALGLR